MSQTHLLEISFTYLSKRSSGYLSKISRRYPRNYDTLKYLRIKEKLKLFFAAKNRVFAFGSLGFPDILGAYCIFKRSKRYIVLLGWASRSPVFFQLCPAESTILLFWLFWQHSWLPPIHVWCLVQPPL